MANRKEISAIVFVACVMMTLLSCCDPVSSFLSRPHVTRTADAIIIDCIQIISFFFLFEYCLNPDIVFLFFKFSCWRWIFFLPCRQMGEPNR